MPQLVECVPNFSEGNSQEVPSHEDYLSLAKRAPTPISAGEHPRMGALDVCPFIPVRDISMDECVLCAQAFGQRLAEELEVPVYLYGEAARMASRQTLPAIRAGEYEALPEKLKRAEWAPDFGPATFVPSWGATATGARKFLIAFNINLLSTKEQAHRIALNLREQGRGKDQPGLLKKVQGIGWYLDEKNLAQVSTNLLDFEVTALHTIYEETCREAQELNIPVVGSQLVGLVPLKAVLDAATFYCEKENLFILEEEHRIRLVVNRLGLDSLSPFNPKERIIEYLVPEGQPEQCLVNKSLGAFVREVGARSAAPGGGSVAAAVAAMGAALASMVGLMTYGRRQFEHLDAEMRRLIPPFHKASAQLTALVDTDAQAFAGYLVSFHRHGDSLKAQGPEPVLGSRRVRQHQGLASNAGRQGSALTPWKMQEDGTDLEASSISEHSETRQRVSSLLQDAQTQAALVLDRLEARRE
ncbi:formimidoyltransferase-cyclodeaminase [Trichechus manatus latirostris]|uniref:Formimidoyltransferase-cyclodeaminase n=1 Tax=Trichechus manatus latirostris TaxID=127582 RepID=A0A2Y9FZL4_TRIMA|nr:formimidoyltransferase-cyclodeaminase [Trichechus manatus latirostris]